MSETLIEIYLRECEGDPARFENARANNERVGQAFFNALCREDRELLRGTKFDPFNLDGVAALQTITRAIDWLLDITTTRKQ